MSKLDDNIDEALDGLEIDHEPGGGGWIDSQSRKKAIEKLSLLIEDVAKKFAEYCLDEKIYVGAETFTYFISNIYEHRNTP